MGPQRLDYAASDRGQGGRLGPTTRDADLRSVPMNGFDRGTARTPRTMFFSRAFSLAAALLLTCASAGCIERTVSINTEPEGATVFLNDQEVGQSPVTVPFTWYGDYDIAIRKEGYQTVKTNHRIKTPWYQWPFIDLFTECLIPFTVHDDHILDTYVLTEARPLETEILLQAAAEMRARAHVGDEE